MQHSRKLTRAACAATWLVLLVTVLSATALARVDHPPVRVELGAVYAWCGLSLAVALVLTWLASGLASAAAARAQAPALLSILVVADLAADTGVVAATGGVAGPFWVLFLPVVLFSSLSLPPSWAVGVGVLGSGGLVGGSAIATGLTGGVLGELLLIAPLLPAVACFTAVLSQSVLTLGRRAVAERDVLAEHVGELSVTLAQAASGDLAVAVPRPRTSDQPRDAAMAAALDQLGASFTSTLSDLRRLVGSIRGGGDQITTSAAELLKTAEEHAASATQQSSAVSETTSTIEELAATAAQIAETAEAVAQYAADTLRYAEQGAEAVQLSVDAMDRISVRVDGIARRALTLGDRTQEIGRIVGVIDDLADQTNMLALNAAIEAARAGEHGRGFAVVASEVRKLAERAQQSTGQIRDIVGEVQAETNATIIASEEGAKEARLGNELARGVVDALERISGMVDETTIAAKEISIATQQQRSASDQVVAAMTQVSDVSRHYAVGSRQTAASAAQLTAVAAELRDAIAQFTVA